MSNIPKIWQLTLAFVIQPTFLISAPSIFSKATAWVHLEKQKLIMLKIIFQTSLFFHVIAGILALASGLVAMTYGKKGGKIHLLSGNIFYWSMAFIFITTIIFFVIYHVISISGEKFAREGVILPWKGMWISSVVLLPIGIFLSYKAATDSALFDKESYRKFFRKILKNKR